MQLSDFDFDLPEELIAQQPAADRDQSRLMLVERSTGRIEHHQFFQLPTLLEPSDLLVLNDTRVLQARLAGHFADTGGRAEILLLEATSDQGWEALVRPARRFRKGRRITFSEERFTATVTGGKAGEATRQLRFDGAGDFHQWLRQAGQIPLPPYIRRDPEAADASRYQTVYASNSGSVAAPTAGLHFTPRLLRSLDSCRLTLHVGYGTFKPVRLKEIDNHGMERERYSIPAESAERIARQLEQGRRVVAVGTTTTRALEHAALETGNIRRTTAAADLFIHNGFEFRVVGAVVTNFHLPRSTLLMLVSAFAGRELIRTAYEEAIQQGYRFYSYGDAMLLV